MLVDRTFMMARRWSNRELRKIGPLLEGDVMNVSGWADLDKEGGKYRDYFKRAKRYLRTNYAKGSRGLQGDNDEISLDLTAPLAESLHSSCDVAFNHTTLEHIFDVRTAFANLCLLSRDVVIVVVPFSQVQHENDSYADYWRFTPSCLRQLFAENGLTVIYEAESPHKDAAIYLFFVASRHPERHRGILPEHRKVRVAGRWIGASTLISGIQFLRYRGGKLATAVRKRMR